MDCRYWLCLSLVIACGCALATNHTTGCDLCSSLENCVTNSSTNATSCVCKDGYFRNGTGTNCTDINECSNGTNPCHEKAVCLNTVGSYNCTCEYPHSDGKYYAGNGTHCEEVCPPTTATTCKQYEICVRDSDTAPWKCECGPGYKQGLKVCEDIDECQIGGYCHQEATCKNSMGSYKCTCKPGYYGSGNNVTGGCLDIDECASNTTNKCDVNAHCNNTIGSYNCTCNKHYEGNGFNCSAINKCLYDEMNDCSEHATCTQDGISYTCKCNGLLYGNGTHCYDPCNTTETCEPNSVCVNLGNNTRTCRCKAGYFKHGQNCTEIQSAYSTKIKILNILYHEDLSNPLSKLHVETARYVESELYTLVKTNISDVIAVKVISFANGSVITDFYFVMNATAPKNTNTPSLIKKALKNAAENQNLTKLHIDADFDHDVTDMDKCNVNGDCDSNAYCANSTHPYVCMCNKGYTGNGTYCEDLNECLGVNNCSVNATCRNTIGSYNCTCGEKNGKYFEGDGFQCEEVCPPDHCKNQLHKVCTSDGVGGWKCICGPGFEQGLKVCEDINECERNNTCHADADCVNTQGSYNCTCKNGYRGDGRNCTDINECEELNVTCSTYATCANYPGTYNCTCKEHYEGDGVNCTAINKCLYPEMNDCSEHATCTQNGTSYTCKCNGLLFGNGTHCYDPCNETNTCPGSATCINLGNNQTDCKCTEGFYFDGRTCLRIEVGYEAKIRIMNLTYHEDLANQASKQHIEMARFVEGELLSLMRTNISDVVAVKVKKFENGSVIVNFFVVMNVTLPKGNDTATLIKQALNAAARDPSLTKLQIDPGFDHAIVDLDQCIPNDPNSPCHKNATCTDQRPYRCQCNKGFSGNGTYCQDIDECATGDSNCHRGAICNNTIGSFYCTCGVVNGEHFEGNGTHCEEICPPTLCPDKEECISNGTGGWKCVCPEGYKRGTKVCEDINECEGNNTCHADADCVNTQGSYNCTCKDGYQGDGRNCTDIDECASNTTNKCDVNAHCNNTIGSYNCTCNKHYEGNGFNCSAINKCLYDEMNDCSEHATCTQDGISYTCKCNGLLYGNGTHCYDPCNVTDPCGVNSVCVNMGNATTTCRCKQGYYKHNDTCLEIKAAFSTKIKITNIAYHEDLSNPSSKHHVDTARYVEKELFTLVKTNISDVVAVKVISFVNGSVIAEFYFVLNASAPKRPDTSDLIKQVLKNAAMNRNLTSLHIDPNFEHPVTDMDQCNVNGDCDSNAYCANSTHPYVCMCNKGYTGNGTYCEDIDECATNTSDCHPGAVCKNTMGSYNCTCGIINGEHFVGNGTYCEEICPPGNCKDIKECVSDGSGGWKCVCPSGYKEGVKLCEDIDECNGNNTCHTDAKCTNFPGSYNCTCKAGYKGDGRNCTDVNECESNNGGCPDVSTCVNVPGTYNCSCGAGYENTPDRKNCTDINECDGNPCHVNAECTNFPGSYNCTCRDGYKGDGRNCTAFTTTTAPTTTTISTTAVTTTINTTAATTTLNTTAPTTTMNTTAATTTMNTTAAATTMNTTAAATTMNTTAAATTMNTTAAATTMNTTVSATTVNATVAPMTTTVAPDPCDTITCQAFATCSVIDGVATCTCLSGYYDNNGTCTRIAKKFKAEMKIQETFTPELKNKSSAKYQSLKSNVENGLEKSLKAAQPAIEKVEVTAFREGSVIADYDMIITDEDAAENITADSIESAVHTAITTANFTGIAVNKTYLPTVQKVDIVYGTTAQPSTAAATTTTTAKPSTAASTSTAEPSTAATSTAEPSTTAASTAEPSTTAASTAEPSTTAASTAEPSTTAASTVQPTTTTSNVTVATDTLTTAEPSTTAASTAEPSTTKASTAEPSTTGASTAEPSTAEASTAEPSTTEATTAEPSTTEASTAEPSTTEASTAEPSTTEASTAESSTTVASTAKPSTAAATSTAKPSTAAATSTAKPSTAAATSTAAPATTTPAPDPCDTITCPSFATCSVIDGVATCTCLSGYYSNNGTCTRIAKKFKAEMKIQEQFTSELTNKSSAKYQSLKTNVETGLEKSLKAAQPAIEKVDVTAFRPGSVIADFEMIITDADAAENISASSIESATHAAITTANFTGITVNKTYLPAVQQVPITYGSTAAPITVAPSTSIPPTVRVTVDPCSSTDASTCQSGTCIANSCRCAVGYSVRNGVCTSGSMVTVENLVLKDVDYNADFADSKSIAFVNFSKSFEPAMMTFIKGSIGIDVIGVQVTDLTDGSTVVKFIVIYDAASQGKKPTELSSVLTRRLVNDTFNIGRYLAVYNIDTDKPPRSKVVTACQLLASTCGDDFNCLPGDGMEFTCDCKRDSDGNCEKDVLNNWKIAVIVVAIFVFLLMVIIIIAIVRMYRRRHYTGKAYVSEQGRDNTGANLS